MSESMDPKGTDPSRRSANASTYDLWYDGQLEGKARDHEGARIASRPELRARAEADRAIDDSLRRSFGASPGALANAGASTPVLLRSRVPWAPYATAAGLLALVGGAFAINWERGDPPANVTNVARGMNGHTVDDVTSTARSSVRAQPASYSLGEVFLDALALDFQPLLGCSSGDEWNQDLVAQLALAPCAQEQGVVVLGEWLDPRLDVASMYLLRRGGNPIMLVVPRCEQDTELCVPKDSGLYVHRGMLDGRAIYEISPGPGSEVLECVDADSVVTQHQL